MNIRNSIVVVCMIIGLYGSNVFAQTAGEFQLPFDENQVWVPDCGNGNGYKNPPDQYHTQWNSTFNGYHIGEDWNGVCGFDTDLNAPLYAIADGIVDEVGNDSSRGKWLSIIYTLPDGKQVKSVYFHLNDILVTVNNPVYKNSTVIAKIGNTGASTYAHLHWGMLTDMNAPIVGYNQLSITDALKYTPPALFVDDRASGGITIPMTNGVWTQFTVQNYTPSSTAYVQDLANERYSIQRAVDLGIIELYGIFWQGTDGNWYYNPDVTKVFLEPNVNYSIIAKANSLSLNLLFPGNNFLADRARSDMVYAASQNGNFQDVIAVSYQENLSWDPSWELRQMPFTTVIQTSGWIYHATNITNRFLRYTAYYDPSTGVWTGWTLVDNNKLY